MDNLQAMIDGFCANEQRIRAGEQMTLGRVIEILESMPEDLEIDQLGSLNSYRGYYCDLAFSPDGGLKTVKEILVAFRAAMGKIFTGYKGGDYVMGEITPIWIANYGCCGVKLMAIHKDGTIETEN